MTLCITLSSHRECICFGHILSIQVINHYKLRITFPPTHKHYMQWIWKCVGGCSELISEGIPVCGQEGGAEVAHVFSYVRRCVTLNRFTFSSAIGFSGFLYFKWCTFCRWKRLCLFSFFLFSTFIVLQV